MDANRWATDDQPALSSARARKPNRRRMITNPVEAYERALRLGLSAKEAAEAARQAEVNARHHRLVEEEEDRMVRENHRKSRSLFGLSSY